MENLRLHSNLSLRLVEASDLGHPGFIAAPLVLLLGVGVVLPSLLLCCDWGTPKGNCRLSLNVLQAQRFLASRDTRWVTPRGGMLPGVILNGVMVGSWIYNWYVFHR